MTALTFADLSPGVVIEGPTPPEPVEVLAVMACVKVIGRDLRSGDVREPILGAKRLARLSFSPVPPPFDGTSLHFKLGIVDRPEGTTARPEEPKVALGKLGPSEDTSSTRGTGS
jgi:hypothetical protein